MANRSIPAEISRHRTLVIFTMLTVLLIPAGAGLAEQKLPARAKEPVQDGHVYHDAGQLWNHVTNWGLIGSCPTVAFPFSGAPSARWPGADGPDHLWAGGLWVGGRVLGEALVSEGGFGSEFYPTAAAADTIYPSFQGMAGGNRYPWPLADDDRDFAEDEDPPNGLDDDQDGRIDEDFAAAGDQSFRCAYHDTSALIQELNPDHTPLNIRVIQATYQWSGPRLQDAIGYQFTVENFGVVPIADVYLGFFADFDIPALQGEAEDDMAGGWSGMVLTEAGFWVPVNLAYMYDVDGTAGSGYAGVALCGHDSADPDPVLPVAQIFSGQQAFDEGGDPTNDSERYQLLSAPDWDADSQTGKDHRVLLSLGPFAQLDPGEQIVLRAALVAGADLDDLITNAAEMVETAQGRSFDRDGLPENGEEFAVRWLPWEDIPSPVDDEEGTPARVLTLRAHPNPFNPCLVIELGERIDPVQVTIFDVRGRLVRQLAAAGAVRLEWDGQDQAGRDLPSGVYRVVARWGDRSADQKVTLLR